jgi:hypothetical protein
MNLRRVAGIPAAVLVLVLLSDVPGRTELIDRIEGQYLFATGPRGESSGTFDSFILSLTNGSVTFFSGGGTIPELTGLEATALLVNVAQPENQAHLTATDGVSESITINQFDGTNITNSAVVDIFNPGQIELTGSEAGRITAPIQLDFDNTTSEFQDLLALFRAGGQILIEYEGLIIDPVDDPSTNFLGDVTIPFISSIGQQQPFRARFVITPLQEIPEPAALLVWAAAGVVGLTWWRRWARPA